MKKFVALLPLLAACAENSGALSMDEDFQSLVGAHVDVVLDSATPTPKLVLGGAGNVPVSKFKLTAVGEDMVVDRFSLEIPGDPTDVAYVTVQYTDSSNTLVSSSHGVGTDGFARFPGEDLALTENVPADLTAKVTLNTSGTPGDTFQADWSNDRFHAIGDSTDLYGPNRATASVVSNTFIYHWTKPVINLTSFVRPADTGEIIEFYVAALFQNPFQSDVGLETFAFEIHATDVDQTDWNACGTGITASDFDFYNITVDGLSQTLELSDSAWTLLNASGTTCQSGQDIAALMLTIPTEYVSTGTTDALGLYMDSSGASTAHHDTIRVDLVDMGWKDDIYGPFDGAMVSGLPLTDVHTY